MNRLEQLNQLLTESPNDSFVLFAIAKEYLNLGELQSALSFFQRLEQTDPDYVGMYLHFGRLKIQQGNLDSAKELFLKGIAIADKLKDAHAASELRRELMEI